MYIYILVSSIYLSFFIYKNCNKKIEEPDFFEELYEDFPSNNYIERVNLLSFFSKETNYSKLSKVFNNNIYKKMVDVVLFNKDIITEYDLMKEKLGDNVFNFEEGYTIPIEINGNIFNTSISKLNFIRWFIISDYFLYIDKIEN